MIFRMRLAPIPSIMRTANGENMNDKMINKMIRIAPIFIELWLFLPGICDQMIREIEVDQIPF